MGFYYAVQVPVGQEGYAKYMIESVIDKFNPGILGVHPMLTFTQMFKSKNTAAKEVRSILPGYILVEIQTTERHGLGMDQHCWQLLRKIPLVRSILNKYIHHEEVSKFFDTADLEPDVQVLVQDTEDREEDRPLISLAQKAIEFLKNKKDKAAQNTISMLEKITGKARGKKSVYKVPYSLFHQTRDRIDPGKTATVKQLTTGMYIIPKIADTIRSITSYFEAGASVA